MSTTEQPKKRGRKSKKATLVRPKVQVDVTAEPAHREQFEILWIAPTKLDFIPGNRDVNEAHVNKLKKAIAENNLLHLNPIRINDKHQIIDGQHRTFAAMELNLATVPCVIVRAGIDEVKRLNANARNWNYIDFAKSYALENSNYQTFLNFHKETGFGINECTFLLSGKKDSMVNFRNGNFTIGSIRDAYDVVDKIKDFKEQLKDGYKSRSFVLAFTQVCRTPNYDHKRMMHKIGVYGGIRKQPSREFYLDHMETIYNYNAGKDNRLSFSRSI